MKQAIVMNFDAIVTKDGQVYFIEPGNGITRTGYDSAPGIKEMKDHILDDILSQYSHIYIVSPNAKDFKLSDLQQYTSESDKVSALGLDQFLQLADEHKLADNCVVLLNNDQHSKLQPHHLAALLKAKEINVPVINDSAAMRVMLSKLLFQEQLSTSPYLPKSFSIRDSDYTSFNEIYNKITGDRVVLKPFDGTRAHGIALVEKELLPDIFDYLSHNDHELPQHIKSQLGEQNLKKLAELKQSNNESDLYGFVIQQFIPPKIIKHNENNYRVATRIVCSLYYDETTGAETFKVIGHQHKSAMKPVTDQEDFCWEDTISYSELNAHVASLGSLSQASKQYAAAPYKPSYVKLRTALPVSVKDEQALNTAATESLLPLMRNCIKNTGIKTVITTIDKASTSTIRTLPLERIQYDTLTTEALTKLAALEPKINIPMLVLYALYYHLQAAHIIKYYDGVDLSLLGFVSEFINSHNGSEISKLDIATVMTRFTELVRECGLLNHSEFEKHKKLFFENMFPFINKELPKPPLQPIATADDYYKFALLLFKNESVDTALSYFKKALDAYKTPLKQAMCYYNIASCYLRLENLDEALEAADISLRLRTDNPGSDDKKITASQRKVDEIKLRQNVITQATEAVNLFKKGSHKEALPLFQFAVATWPCDDARKATYFYNLGSCHAHLQQTKEAIANTSQSHTMRQKLFGNGHKDTIKARDKLQQLQGTCHLTI